MMAASFEASLNFIRLRGGGGNVFQNKLHSRADFFNLIAFLKLQNVPKSRIHFNTYWRGAYIQGMGVISLEGGCL